mgnify:CR=1 FL=1
MGPRAHVLGGKVATVGGRMIDGAARILISEFFKRFTALAGGAAHEAHAAAEVILAGGVINSPQLLMLAGIGEADALRAHDIEVRADLPGVGKNLQDHISAGAVYARKGSSPFVRQMRYDRLAIDMPLAYLFGKGPATQYPVGPHGYMKLDADAEAPDIQVLFGAGPMDAHPWFPGIRKAFNNAFSARAMPKPAA